MGLMERISTSLNSLKIFWRGGNSAWHSLHFDFQKWTMTIFLSANSRNATLFPPTDGSSKSGAFDPTLRPSWDQQRNTATESRRKVEQILSTVVFRT
jgi:hypothetical protein